MYGLLVPNSIMVVYMDPLGYKLTLLHTPNAYVSYYSYSKVGTFALRGI